MAKSNLQLKHAALVYLALFWCTFVYAAESPLVAGLESIPARALVYVLILSMVGGAASTLNKLSRSDTAVPRLGLQICKDIFLSLFAGAVMFLFTSWAPSVTFWPQAILITFAGYGGGKLIDNQFTEVVAPAMTGFMKRLLAVFGIAPPKDGETK